jgi:two-component system nitrate/nitrite response regulator NarL
MTTVLLVDDHEVVRAGLRVLLDAEEDIDVVGEASCAEEGIRQARRLGPDIVLLDNVMPGRKGVDAIPDIRRAAPSARIVMLSMDHPGLHLETLRDPPVRLIHQIPVEPDGLLAIPLG